MQLTKDAYSVGRLDNYLGTGTIHTSFWSFRLASEAQCICGGVELCPKLARHAFSMLAKTLIIDLSGRHRL